MDIRGFSESFFDGVKQMFIEQNALRSVLILVGSMLAAYWLSKFVARGTVWLAQQVASRGDKETDDQRNLHYRQAETYLSIAVAIIRVGIVGYVGYMTWNMLNPQTVSNQAANGLAAIGAGTIFVIFAGQTLGIILRDLTAGVTMIAEGWFHVGDYVQIDPYTDMAGVVERFTLRSTRIRALNGEIIWVHNQHILGVRVTPRGVRTIAVEIFIKNKDRGLQAVQSLIDAIPLGKTMLAKPLVIDSVEKWAGESWHLTVTGQTAPGREWLIQEYFFGAVKSLDENNEDGIALLAHPPLVHMADQTADKRFRRAVRVSQKR